LPEEPVFVANWTSEDFSRVYVKYRPALVRHARKWLHHSTEIDEVVQDAFLYLFLSLPELDSEIGVLRFLKWKTRLLCLDVLRAQNRRPILLRDSVENENEPSTEDGPADVLERMHDAAIVHAALAQIPERQREALLRFEFQEQSAAEIAEKLGLSENASRQLIHRARRNLRNSLIEQLGSQDLDVSDILSIAVKKAKQNASKGVALVLLVGLALIGAADRSWLPWNSQNQIDLVQSTPETFKPTPTASPQESEAKEPISEPSIDVTPSESPSNSGEMVDLTPTPSSTTSVEVLEQSATYGSTFNYQGIAAAAEQAKISGYEFTPDVLTQFQVISENGLGGDFILEKSGLGLNLEVKIFDQSSGKALNLEELKLSRSVLEDGTIRFIYIYQVNSPESEFTESFLGVVVQFNLDLSLRTTPLISELFV
jgi:RNA polymerase sigma-70 factor (ECF subfamily)